MMVTTNLVGTNASFNNICLTPTPAGNVPMLYPNNVITTTSVPAATHVFTGCGIAMNMNGQAPVSLGDMPGLGMVLCQELSRWLSDILWDVLPFC